MSNSSKKAAKRKAKLKNRKKSQPSNNNLNASYIRKAKNCDVYQCQINGSFEDGLVAISVSKRVAPNVVVMAAFNVDLYCLGIKDTFIRSTTMERYEQFMNNPIYSHYNPEDAKKLIEEAVEYAAGIGFKPHKDFKKTFTILNNVDSSKSSMEFTFGKDGQPLFIAGPNDSPQRCEKIISTMEKFTKEGESAFIMPIPVDDEFDDLAGE